jgi:uncharacterized protein (DUF1501 family)
MSRHPESGRRRFLCIGVGALTLPGLLRLRAAADRDRGRTALVLLYCHGGNFDRCVSALLEDLHDRGLNERVMVVVSGEFGRTPHISRAVGSVTKVSQPGRDHWPAAMSMLFSGGGVAGGQVIGATDRLGRHPVRRQVGPWDFLATVYAHLSIDAASASVPDPTGRPVPILPEGEPIAELTAGPRGR